MPAIIRMIQAMRLSDQKSRVVPELLPGVGEVVLLYCGHCSLKILRQESALKPISLTIGPHCAVSAARRLRKSSGDELRASSPIVARPDITSSVSNALRSAALSLLIMSPGVLAGI